MTVNAAHARYRRRASERAGSTTRPSSQRLRIPVERGAHASPTAATAPTDAPGAHPFRQRRHRRRGRRAELPRRRHAGAGRAGARGRAAAPGRRCAPARPRRRRRGRRTSGWRSGGWTRPWSRRLAWRPDVAFVHNMRPLEVDGAPDAPPCPTVKIMHGYFGTCVSGLKSHLVAAPVAVRQAAGPRLLPHLRHAPVRAHAPRLRGRRLALGATSRTTCSTDTRPSSPPAATCATSTCATAPRRTACTPSPSFPRSPASRPIRPAAFRVLFLGRMTAIKGGDLLIRAVADASDAPRPAHPADDGGRRAAARRVGAAGGAAGRGRGLHGMGG